MAKNIPYNQCLQINFFHFRLGVLKKALQVQRNATQRNENSGLRREKIISKNFKLTYHN